MRRPARGILRLLAGSIACASLSVPDSSAQSYPAKPVRILVGYVPGGATDFTARAVAPKLSELLGQPVIVENRPGASGSLATARVAASPADGYTLLILTAADTVQPALRAKLPYDLDRDLAPVSLLVIGPELLVVHPSVPVRNIKQLIALARSQSGKLTFGSAGPGGPNHLAGVLFNSMAKLDIVHVPYKGAAQTVVAIAGGEVDMSFASIPATLPLLKAGKLRALAVTSEQRTPLAPSLPTVSESGLPGYQHFVWYGLSAPAGVPKAIIARLNEVVGTAANTPETKELLNKQGLQPQTNTPEQFAAFVRNETALNAKLIAAAGVKAE